MSAFRPLAQEVHNEEYSKVQKHQVPQASDCASKLPGLSAELQSVLSWGALVELQVESVSEIPRPGKDIPQSVKR